MAPTTSIEDSNSFYTDVQKVSIISKEKKMKIGKNKKTKGNDPFLLNHFTYLLTYLFVFTLAEEKILKYRQPLAHNRTNDQLGSSVKTLLDIMHEKEKNITSITTVRV